MSLSISRTNAQIGIDRTPSRLDIESKSAKLELHQKHAKMNIETEKVKLEIDQYECFASAGLKNTTDRMREAAQRGYEQAMEYIGKVAEDGDTLAAIEKKGNPIASIAERDAYPEHEIGMVTMPSARPKFNVKGSVKLNPEPNGQGVHNGVEGNYLPSSVNINYTPAKINIYMKQYASVSLKYVPDSKLDTSI